MVWMEFTLCRKTRQVDIVTLRPPRLPLPELRTIAHDLLAWCDAHIEAAKDREKDG
jgi:hypothetical protein